MSATPRTNAKSTQLYSGKFNMMEIADAFQEHANQLETELAAAKEACSLAETALGVATQEAERLKEFAEADRSMRSDLIASLRQEAESAKRDKLRMDWLCKFTEFRFRVYDSKERRFLRENFAQGAVIRPVIDAAIEKYPTP